MKKREPSKDKYERFCQVCKRVTHEFECCGTRTRRLNMRFTIGDKVKQYGSESKTKST